MMNPYQSRFSFIVIALIVFVGQSSSFTFHSTPSHVTASKKPSFTRCCPNLNDRYMLIRTSSSSNDDDQQIESSSEEDLEDLPMIGNVTMDDGGSDLTERFRYKMNALLGVFDPKSGPDDDRQDGNILSAIMNFPAQYAFRVVGRTEEEGSELVYVQEVRRIVMAGSGDEEAEWKVIPRGKKFTRVTVTATVGSASIVNSIYQDLADLENTVMRY
eukprot:scaffold47193_cov58-Attheya_sp.AAC.8